MARQPDIDPGTKASKRWSSKRRASSPGDEKLTERAGKAEDAFETW